MLSPAWASKFDPIDLLYFFSQLVFIASVLARDGPISFSGRNAANFKRALVCRWKLATTPKCFRYTQCNFPKTRVENVYSFVSMSKLREVHPRVNGDL